MRRFVHPSLGAIRRTPKPAVSGLWQQKLGKWRGCRDEGWGGGGGRGRGETEKSGWGERERDRQAETERESEERGRDRENERASERPSERERERPEATVNAIFSRRKPTQVRSTLSFGVKADLGLIT